MNCQVKNLTLPLLNLTHSLSVLRLVLHVGMGIYKNLVIIISLPVSLINLIPYHFSYQFSLGSLWLTPPLINSYNNKATHVVFPLVFRYGQLSVSMLSVQVLVQSPVLSAQCISFYFTITLLSFCRIKIKVCPYPRWRLHLLLHTN